MKNTSAVTGPEHIYVCMIYFLTIDGILIVLTLIIFEFLALNFYKPRNCNLLIILFACTSTYMIYGHVPTYLGISISSTYLIYLSHLSHLPTVLYILLYILSICRATQITSGLGTDAR